MNSAIFENIRYEGNLSNDLLFRNQTPIYDHAMQSHYASINEAKRLNFDRNYHMDRIRLGCKGKFIDSDKRHYFPFAATDSQSTKQIPRDRRLMDSEHIIRSTSTSLPLGSLTYLSPNIIKYYNMRRSGERLVGSKRQVMTWEQEHVIALSTQTAGEVAPYQPDRFQKAAGFTHDSVATGQNRYSIGLIMDNDQIQRFGSISISVYDQLVLGCFEALKQYTNKLIFYGYPVPWTPAAVTAYDVRGLINSPLLSAVVSWATAFNANTPAYTALNFFNTIINNLEKQTGYNFSSEEHKMRLGMPASAWNFVRNSYPPNDRRTVKEILAVNYPNLEIIPCPELENCLTGNKNMAILIGEDPQSVAGGGPVCEVGVSQQAMTTPMERRKDTYECMFSSGCSGTIVYKPSFIVRMSGM